jgi:hypothetical protein
MWVGKRKMAEMELRLERLERMEGEMGERVSSLVNWRSYMAGVESGAEGWKKLAEQVVVGGSVEKLQEKSGEGLRSRSSVNDMEPGELERMSWQSGDGLSGTPLIDALRRERKERDREIWAMASNQRPLVEDQQDLADKELLRQAEEEEARMEDPEMDWGIEDGELPPMDREVPRMNGHGWLGSSSEPDSRDHL